MIKLWSGFFILIIYKSSYFHRETLQSGHILKILNFQTDHLYI